MFLFVDTETTGLVVRFNSAWNDIENWPRMVELAWLLCDIKGRELNSWCGLIRPEGYVIPKTASDIHGITTDMATLEGIRLDDVLMGFIDICEEAECLVGHNIDFDAGVIAAEMVRCGYELSALNLTMICTMRSSTSFCRIPGKNGSYKWPSLSELHYKIFGCPPIAVHRGSDDVRTCARCYFELRDRGIFR